MAFASAPFNLKDYADAARQQTDRALDRYLTFGDAPEALGRMCPPRLADAMRYCVLAPGKRIRPVLVLLAMESCGGQAADAVPAACAVELIHAYSLIHDDLPAMDDDDLRRGQPTCHKKFDEATAILAGDALQALAFEILARDIQPAAAAAACCAALGRAAGPTALVGGQADDLAAEHQQGSVEQLAAIHARKTAAMFAVSAQLGGICAGVEIARLDALENYGYNLGMAFQVMDDVLDVLGTQDAMGKRVGKDADRGKLTYPGLLGVEQSVDRAKDYVEQALAAAALAAPRTDGLEALAHFVIQRDR